MCGLFYNFEFLARNGAHDRMTCIYKKRKQERTMRNVRLLCYLLQIYQSRIYSKCPNQLSIVHYYFTFKTMLTKKEAANINGIFLFLLLQNVLNLIYLE